MTKFRLFMLLFAAACLAAVLVGVHLLERRGRLHMTLLQKALLVLGLLLTLDTVIVSFLSNFNLGVILPAFFGLPLVALAFLLPHMQHGFLLFLKWFTAACYGVAIVIFLVCGTLMTVAAHEGDRQEADAVIVLGAAVHGDRVTWVLSNRLDAAIAYLDAHPDAIAVVSGGQGAGETVTEGSAMKKYMLEHGVAGGARHRRGARHEHIGKLRLFHGAHRRGAGCGRAHRVRDDGLPRVPRRRGCRGAGHRGVRHPGRGRVVHRAQQLPARVRGHLRLRPARHDLTGRARPAGAFFFQEPSP